MSQAGTYVAGSTPIIPVLKLTGNVGGAVSPSGAGNIDLVGDGTIVITTGTPASNLLTINVSDATTTNKGVVELATDAETIAGSDTTRSVVPSGLAAKLGDQTQYALTYGNTTSGALQWTAAGTNGQLIIAATGAAPAFANLTSTDATITITEGANSIDLSADTAGMELTVDTDSGSATSVGHVLQVVGGADIATSGLGDTVTISVSGTTDHAVQIGNASGSLDSIAVGTNGQVLIGATAADPAFATLTSADGSVVFATGANSLDLTVDIAAGGGIDGLIPDSGTSPVVPDASGDVTVSGGTTGLTFVGGLNSLTQSGTLIVANGGTGATSLTDHGVLVGSGTGAVTALAVGTDGQVLVGATGADPAMATLTSADGSVVFATGANTLDLTVDIAAGGGIDGLIPDSGTSPVVPDASGDVTMAGGTLISTVGGTNTLTFNLDNGTDGQLIIGSTAGSPAYANLASADSSVTITNGSNSIDLSVNTGITWTEVTMDTGMSVNNGYIANDTSAVTLTLPDTAAVGSIIRIVGKGSGGWDIAQNAGETIYWDSATATTTGVGGSIASTDQYDAIELVCMTANTDWVVLSAKGNLTIT